MRWALFAVAALGCGPMLPTVPEASHAGDVPVRVPYPPPPARVDIVPPPPSEDALWADGTWVWSGRDYSWQAGGWQPPGTVRAPMAVVRRASGELAFYRAVVRRR